ncbi:hypothetical protein G6F22_013163 [Rhizopus arrhizus]|nr:hypothetical protein G6F22_013163 [Rhizopus arrhizus]
MWPATISDSPSTTSNGARLRQQEPVEEAGAAGLRHHDVAQVQAARSDHHADQGEAHRDFVADHLRRGAHGTQERVLRVGRPTGKDDAVDAQRGHRQQVQQAGVGVGQHDLRIEGHHRPGREGRGQGDQRGQQVDRLVGAARLHHFLEQQLEDVGEGLEDAHAHTT